MNIVYPIISLGLLVLVWFLVAKAVDIQLIVPRVGDTFSKLWRLLGENSFYLALGGTLWRSLLSFFIALVLAILLAIISNFIPVIYKLLTPIVTIIRAIPTMSVILLTIIWLNSDYSPLLITLFIIFPIMYSNFYTGITSVDSELIEMSKAYNVRKKDMIFSLYLPNIAPSFFDTLQSAISLNVKIIISAEVLAQTKLSMGLMMKLSKGILDTSELLAWTIVAILLSYFLENVIILIKKLVIRW